MRLRVLVLFMGFAAQAAWGANLSAIYLQAREHDPLYAAAQAADRAGREKLPQARAGLLPSLVMSAFLRQTHSDSSVSASSSYSSPGLSLSLSQPLWRVQNREAYAQGELQAQLAEQQLRVAGQELVLRAARTYFDVLQAENALATAQAQKTAIAEQLAQAKKSFEVGTATITDTHEAQARFDLTMAEEIAAGNDLEIKRAALERLIGASVPGLAHLGDKVALPRPNPERLDDWLQRAGEESLPVKLARTGLDIATHEVARQRGGHQPTVDLTASVSDVRNQTVSGITGVDSRSGVIGLELNWPLYQGGLVDSRIREAQANLDRARFDLDNARRQALLDARQGYLGVVSGQARVAALEQALASGELQRKSTRLGLEVGVRTRVDVLNTEQQIFTTQRDLSAARYQTLQAALQLKASAGQLTAEDLKAIDALLQE